MTSSMINVARNLFNRPAAEGGKGQYPIYQIDSLSNDHLTFSLWTTKPKSQKGVFANSKINRTSVVSGHLYKTSATQGCICGTCARYCRSVGPRWNINFPEEAAMQTGPEAR